MNVVKWLLVYLTRDIIITEANKYFFEDMMKIIPDTGYGHVATSVNFTGIENDLGHLNTYAMKVSKYQMRFPNNTFVLALKKKEQFYIYKLNSCYSLEVIASNKWPIL